MSEIIEGNSGFQNLDAADNAARFHQLLTSLEFLDADPQTRQTITLPTGVQVTYGSSARGITTASPRLLGDITLMRTGDYITVPDELGIDEHGFFVAGWGPIQACPTALSRNWSLALNPVTVTEMGLLYPDHDSALQGYATRPYVVLYVVDFPGGVDRIPVNYTPTATHAGALSDQLQRPKPRPFYCSGYDDPATTPVRPDGTSAASFFDPRYDTGYWRFYTLPGSRVAIPAERLYFPRDEWFWNTTRCAMFANCGG